MIGLRKRKGSLFKVRCFVINTIFEFILFKIPLPPLSSFLHTCEFRSEGGVGQSSSDTRHPTSDPIITKYPKSSLPQNSRSESPLLYLKILSASESSSEPTFPLQKLSPNQFQTRSEAARNNKKSDHRNPNYFWRTPNWRSKSKTTSQMD